jgi:hypothetical protein
MPRIPIYQERQAVNQGMGVREVSAPRTDTGAMGRSMEQLGKAMGQMAQAQINVEEENAKAWALENLVQDEMNEAELLTRRQTDSNFIKPGADGFTKDVLKDFDDRYNKKLAEVPDGPGKKFYLDGLRKMRTALFDKSLAFEAIEGQKYTINTALKASHGYAQLSMQNPDPLDVDVRIGQYDAWVDSLNRLSPSQKQTLKDNNKELIYGAALDGAIMQDPDGFLAQGTDNPLFKNIPADKVDDYVNKAKIQSDKVKAQNTETITSWVWQSVLEGQSPDSISASPAFKTLDPKLQASLIGQMKSFTTKDEGANPAQLEFYLKLSSDPEKLAALTDAQIVAMAPVLGKTLIGQIQRERAKLNDPNNVLEAKLDNDVFKSVAQTAGLKPYESGKTPAEIERLANFELTIKNRIDAEQRVRKRPLTIDEKRAIADNEAKNIVFVDAFGPDKKMPIGAVERDRLGDTYVNVGETRVMLSSIPPTSRDKIIRQLRERKPPIPVTEQAIAELYVLQRNQP